ncbi:MAG: Sec-independent protein translocase protein TatB [Gammaproteobacteria bacterium]|jgi:sec-independent protein translocase protein TatB
MFDVGFSEIVLIAVIALLVVGPKEFPALVRNIGSWLGRIRQFMSAVKTEFEREINKADEIKSLMTKEMEVAELHKNLDPHRRAAAPPDANAASGGEESSAPPGGADKPAPAAKQDHGSPQS